ncbi:hypothetical protein PSA01_29540 [Pseudonocardia saturnea]|uniref:ChsH2 C-terminal OB-fold domain-containing protein n=1 Tax=Pseudonocardia saturnea TaxID=33909 RepID=A0ABQ0RZ35_9PSEU|nr:hypothetical protein Pdca_39510 [Pseudonocardia autotrophica]GEC25925.1 hypothetical protein PSA01_29540 [Pseudonocardia saturnea]
MPKAYCHRCGSWETDWRVVPGRGSLLTWTVVTHQVHPAHPVPYTVVLVAVDGCGAHLVGSLPGRPELATGQPMEVWFEHLDHGVVLPNWRPVAPHE